MLATGCDTVLGEAGLLAGRRYGLLAHGASLSAALEPLHLALARSGAGAPAALFGPEHGFYGVEQDMVASADRRDPWTGAPIVSLYGDEVASLRPSAAAFDGLELLLIDLQDVGSRYYTYAATAVWAAEVALARGVEVWVLDRPNPLGGTAIEGNLLRTGFESFVGAFRLPVRHGLTLAELVRLEAIRRGWDRHGLRLVPMPEWRREMVWEDTGRPWIAPSPNMPTPITAQLYPGACLIEATTLSEGRGTTRPFQLVGAPGIEPPALATALAETLDAHRLGGVHFVPACFRPQYQKHAGRHCGGVEAVVTDATVLRAYRVFVHLLAVLHRRFGDTWDWRAEPYEFVADIPAIDLLSGDDVLRRALEADEDPEAWLATWAADEAAFRDERRDALLYPET